MRFFFSLLLLSSAAFAQDPITQLAQDPRWLKLLHYGQFFPWSAVHGEVGGEGFYLSPQGREDPLAELRATVDALEQQTLVGKLKQPASCAFPERLRLISERLGRTFPKPKHCELYEQYLGSVHPQGISLVFSSAFASNPGSMFGHTFLKIMTGRHSDLLDKGVSFAATVPPDEGGALYVVYGLLGGYKGQYSFLSYDQKVGEYVNSENRDLWEYELGFSPEESQRLLNHLWELESNSWFDYYFINKNCSYQLLAVIETVRPEWDLTSGWLWVVPAETVKRLMFYPEAITQVRYRPSQRKKLFQSFAALTPNEAHLFQDLVDQKVSPAEVDSPDVLTTAIQSIQFHRSENKEGLQKLWEEILIQRSKIKQPLSPAVLAATQSYQTPPEHPPEKGHGPIRLAVAQGWLTQQTYTELHLKPAYHDLLNDDRGYPRFSEIDFPNLRLRYFPSSQRLRIEELQFVGMTSLNPLSVFEKRSSWKVDIGIQTPKDLKCLFCSVFHAEMGVGLSLDVFSQKGILYALLGGYGEVGSGLETGLRAGPTLDLGLLLNPWAPYKLRLRTQVYGDLLQSDRPITHTALSLDQSFAWNAHWETRVSIERWLPSLATDAKISLGYYF